MSAAQASAAVVRSARITSAMRADDAPGTFKVLSEVRDDEYATQLLVLSLADRLVKISTQLYGEQRAQAALDEQACEAIQLCGENDF